MTEPARPVRMACQPGSDAEHLVVEYRGYVVTTVSAPRTGTFNAAGTELLDLTRLAAVLPFDLSELRATL